MFPQVKISEAGVRPHIVNPKNLKQNQGNLSMLEACLSYIENDTSARTAVNGCTFTRVIGNTTLACLVYLLFFFVCFILFEYEKGLQCRMVEKGIFLEGVVGGMNLIKINKEILKS